MFFKIKGKAQQTIKPLALLAIALIVFLFFSNKIDKLNNLFKAALRQIVLEIDLSTLKRIDSQLQKNYQFAQSLLMRKTWEDKAAIYKDKAVAKYLFPGGVNAGLFLQAQRIAKKHKVEVRAKFMLLTYLYKEKNQEVFVGFVGLDCAGINLIR